MARYHGKTGRIYVSTTGTGAAVAVISQSTWSISLSRDQVEVTAFGDTNKQYVTGLPDVSGSFSGFWDDTEDTIYTAADSADGTKIYLYPDAANAATKYWYGPAFLDISDVTTEVSGAVTVSGAFRARGAWGRK